MSLPTVAGTWTHSPNNRITFVSLADTTARALYGIKNFLVGTMGFTLKFTCDGTTGPTNNTDTTDRISSSSNTSTQGNGASAACSWFTVTDANGVDWTFANNGASADVFRVSYCTTAGMVVAATHTWLPVVAGADVEVVLATGITMVNNTTSGDRVIHMQATADKKNFRWWLYRAGTCIRSLWFENVTSTVTAMSFSPTFCAWQNSAINLSSMSTAGYPYGPVSGSTIGATDSCSARINGTTVALGGCTEMFLGTFNTNSPFSVPAPELQGAGPLVPLGIATSTAGRQGKIGNRIDAWAAFGSTIAQQDTWGAKQFVMLNGIVVPADGTTTMVYT